MVTVRATTSRVKGDPTSSYPWWLSQFDGGVDGKRLASGKAKQEWIDVLAAARKKRRNEPGRLSTTEYTVGSIIARHYINAEVGIAWPTQKTLAALCGIDVRTLRRALTALEAGGYIRALEIHAMRAKGRPAQVIGLRLPDVEGMWLSYSADFAAPESDANAPDVEGANRPEVSATHGAFVSARKRTKMTASIKNPSIEPLHTEPVSPVESSHPTTTVSASGESSCGGDDKVVTLDSRRAPSPPSAPAASGAWPINPNDPPSDAPYNPARAPNLYRLLSRYCPADIRDAIGFDRDNDYPDGRWLPQSIRAFVHDEFKAGRLTPRRLLDALWPTVATGELRAAFDAGREAHRRRHGIA